MWCGTKSLCELQLYMFLVYYPEAEPSNSTEVLPVSSSLFEAPGYIDVLTSSLNT